MRVVFLFRALTFSLAVITVAEVAFPQALVVTLEAPKVQQSSLFTNPAGFGATTFEELKAGFISKAAPFARNNALGTYDHLLVSAADNSGGVGGKGNYMTVNNSVNKASNPTTLTLAIPQRYFIGAKTGPAVLDLLDIPIRLDPFLRPVRNRASCFVGISDRKI